MPNEQLRSLIQKMIDEGASEDTIKSVISTFKTVNMSPPTPPPIAPVSEPTSWGEGVLNSLSPFGGNEQAGSALGAGARGALGFAQGAIADIPSSIMGMAETVENFRDDPLKTGGNLLEGLRDLPSSIAQTTREAGAKPQEFGRMMGQLTGQPAVTAGAIKGAPLAKAPIGKGIEATGRTMRKYQPLSGVLPRFGEIRTLRNIERGVGRGIENFGSRMQTPPPVSPEVLPPMPSVSEIPMEANIPPVRMPPTLGAPGARFVGQPSGFQAPVSSQTTGFPSGGAIPVESGIMDLANPLPTQILPPPGQRLLGSGSPLNFIDEALNAGEITPEGALSLKARMNSPGPRDAMGRQVAPPQTQGVTPPADPRNAPVLSGGKSSSKTMAEHAEEAAKEMERMGDIQGAKQQREVIRRLSGAPETSPITAEGFGPDFFKPDTSGVLTARLRTQFASPQVVEGLKAQGFKLVGVEGNKMVFKKLQ